VGANIAAPSAARARLIRTVFIDLHYLSLVGAASMFLALVMAELAHIRIIRRASAEPREIADA
jgi:hypothetical protein